MKKILALTLSLILTAGLFTACGNDDMSSSDSSSETAITEETTTESAEDETTEDGEAENTIPEEYAEVADKIESETEWPMLDTIADKTMLSDFYTLDADKYESLLVRKSMISANISEYIIINAGEGKVDDAVKDLEARKDKMVEQDAFYPMDKEVAEAAVIGKVGNYAYLIAHEDASDVENIIKDILG